MNMLKFKIMGVALAQTFLKHANAASLVKANQAVHQAGLFLESEVKESIAGNKAEPVSVDTGRFLNSVNTDNSKTMQSSVFSDVEYAKYLEDGTTRIIARKHFEMSLARNKKKINNIVSKAFSKVNVDTNKII